MSLTSLKGKILLTFILLFVALACTKGKPVSRVNATPEGLAIKGYDPVAYFTGGGPAKGAPEFELSWNSAKWRFESVEHRDLFRADPEKYAPRYGGYCAYAVSQGKTADIDPEAWTIFEGRLYLNLNKDVQGLWERDMQVYIQEADKHWPSIIGK